MTKPTYDEIVAMLVDTLSDSEGAGSDLGPVDWDGKVWLVVERAYQAIDIQHLAYEIERLYK